ncbi:33077_t:CDS:1, partial [Racocetra persica]
VAETNIVEVEDVEEVDVAKTDVVEVENIEEVDVVEEVNVVEDL